MISRKQSRRNNALQQALAMQINDRLLSYSQSTASGADGDDGRLPLILSEQSVASNWVKHEVETALAREQEQKRTMLFPIRLDDAVMEIKTGWPAHSKMPVLL